MRASSHIDRRPAWLRFVPLGLMLCGIVGFFALGLDRHLGCSALRDNRAVLAGWILRNPVLAPITYALVYALVTAFSLPVASLITVAGGFLFGAWLGTFLVIAGATCGSAAVFLAARDALADMVRAKAGPQIERLRAGFSANAFNYLLFLRLVPAFPFWLVNLAPALLGVPLRTFLLATLVGIVPGTFVYVYVGRGLGSILDSGDCRLQDLVQPEILVGLGLLGCLSLIPVFYRKLRARND